jgi:IclR family acetate operon transcriptional repressor
MPRNESVIRAFQIIEYLAASPADVGVRAMAKDLGLTPATAHRFLTSLKHVGYVHQEPAGARYRLGLKFAWLGARAIDSLQIRAVAHPHMERLTALSNETTHLATLDDLEIVYIDKVNNHQAVEMRSRVGGRGCLHGTAVGKAMLAFLADEQRERLLARLKLKALTPATLTDPQRLRRALDQVRAQGYAVDDEENEIGIRCVGAPLFDHTAQVVGAISISGWTITMTPERVPELGEVLIKTCRAISHALGDLRMQ